MLSKTISCNYAFFFSIDLKKVLQNCKVLTMIIKGRIKSFLVSVCTGGSCQIIDPFMVVHCIMGNQGTEIGALIMNDSGLVEVGLCLPL